MMDDELVIGRPAHVELDHVGAHPDGMSEGFDGVRMRNALAARVRDDELPRGHRIRK